MTGDLKKRRGPPGRSVVSKCADVDGKDLSNAPLTYERIWLQAGDAEVTWCQHSQDDEDVPYVRADFYAATIARITELEAKLQRLGRELNLAKYGEPDFAWEIHKAAVADLEARLAAAEADRDQGKRDYCDLMDRHDAHFVSWQSAKARAEKAEAEVDRLKYLLDGDECPDPDKIDALFSRAEAAEAREDALAKAGSEARIALAGMVRPDNAVNLLDDALAAYDARRKGK